MAMKQAQQGGVRVAKPPPPPLPTEPIPGIYNPMPPRIQPPPPQLLFKVHSALCFVLISLFLVRIFAESFSK